jgi:hypothetical protein
MLLEDTLEEIADRYIPAGTHELLHINSRQAWVTAVLELIKYNSTIKPTKKVLASLANNWEYLLVTKFSTLN